MNCTEADTLMQRSLDTVLTKAERIELDSHLQSCSTCTRAFAEYRTLTRLVRDWSAPENASSDQSQAFLAGIMNAIERAPAPRPSAALQYLAVGAFVVVVVGVVGYLTSDVQSVPSIGPVSMHPMGILDSVTTTLLSVPRDETQSIQQWISESQTALPLNIAAWTAIAVNGLLILSRMLSGRHKAIAGGHNG